MAPPGTGREYPHTKACTDKRLRRILVPGCGMAFVILALLSAGCASAPAATATPAALTSGDTDTLPATTAPTGEAASYHTVSPAVTDTTAATETPVTAISTETTAGETPTTAPVTTAPATVRTGGIVAETSIPVIGDWAYTSENGPSISLTFEESGGFSGTINGNASPPGIWAEVAEYRYTVTLDDGSALTFVYDPGTDSLYEEASPAVLIGRA